MSWLQLAFGLSPPERLSNVNFFQVPKISWIYRNSCDNFFKAQLTTAVWKILLHALSKCKFPALKWRNKLQLFQAV